MMTTYAYFQKQFVPLSEAKIGLMTHALHYGTGLFEGIRGNWNSEHKQLYIFRLKEHYQRMLDGCQILKMNLSLNLEQLCQITVETAAKSGFEEDIYIRPLAYKSAEALGVRLHDLDDDFSVFAFPWGRYLDVDKASCGVSSWRRPSETPQAKITGLYITSALAKTEAIKNGYHEAIMLNADGYVAEGSGENIFLVKDSTLLTPASFEHILMGITRATVIELAHKELGLTTIERRIDRSELYNADECFLTGTAAHITPVTEIDHRPIADGEIGEITKELQKLYAAAIKGCLTKYLRWGTPVYKR